MSENQHLMVSFISKTGLESDLRSVLLELVKASRAEPDCIRYDLSQSNAKPELFFLVECWASEKSLSEHQQTPHFIEGIRKIEALAAQTDVQSINWIEPDGYPFSREEPPQAKELLARPQACNNGNSASNC